MFAPISVSLSPNVSGEDVLKALNVFFRPSEWIEGGEIRFLEKDFEKIFPGFRAMGFASGRTALWAILKSLAIGKGDEVLLQSFTCVVVVNSVLALGGVPVYVDIKKNSYNMDPDDLEKKITPRTRAIIVQHTFGFPAKIEKILAMAKKHKLKVIEDCAHGIDVSYRGKKLGMFGDASFFSFGRDKVLSSVFGGMAITKNKLVFKKIRRFRDSLSYPSRFWLVQQLLHPIIFSVLLPVYNFFSLGKLILVFSQFLRFLSRPVEKIEKKGILPKSIQARLPNGLAFLARFQLRRLRKFNKHRGKMVQFYASKLRGLPVELPLYRSGKEVIPLLRFTIKTERPWELYQFAKSRGIIFSNWYCPAISPAGVDYQVIGYDPSSCSVAESESLKVVNLPTHPRLKLKEAEKVVRVIREFFDDWIKRG